MSHIQYTLIPLILGQITWNIVNPLTNTSDRSSNINYSRQASVTNIATQQNICKEPPPNCRLTIAKEPPPNQPKQIVQSKRLS